MVSDENVDMVKEITNLSRVDARRLIEIYNGDLDAAVVQFLTNGQEALVKKDTAWDESAFAQDRDGGTETNVPSFQIDSSMPDLIQVDPNLSAMSRPPSRVSFRDGATEIFPGPEDFMGEQESGVIGGGQLRPATQANYDSSKWALTLHGEIDDPDPPDRRKTDDEPTFMKPRHDDDLLPNFVAIVTHIPLVRNIVFSGRTGVDYRVWANWWNGSIREEESLESLIDLNDEEYDDWELMAEIQRLFAFAELTIRSYGSVENLTRMRSFQNLPPDSDGPILPSFKQFMHSFEISFSRFQADLNLSRLFRAAVVKEEDGETAPFYTLDIDLDDLDEVLEDLYDTLDMVFWASPDSNFEVASLSEAPKVLTVQLTRSSTKTDGLGISIAEYLYMGRYMTANQEMARAVRDAISTARAEVKKHEKELKKLLEFTKKDGTVVPDMLRVFDDVLRCAPNRSNVSEVVPRVNGLKDQSMFDELDKAYQKLKANVEAVELKKKGVIATVDDHQNWLKAEENKSLPAKNRGYQLRGVIMNKNTTYLAQGFRSKEEAAQEDDWDPKPTGPEWWKFYFGTAGTTSCDRVDVSDVLRAAENDSKNVVLVYASDDAVDVPKLTPIPEALKAFVALDNKTFEREVQTHVDKNREAVRKDRDTEWRDFRMIPPSKSDDDMWTNFIK
ncbi:hypothetical protein P152DRAFT_457890 [Eremomyces bilateralis CBS 781.70]|uniref:UBA domain-containing protein n=1 Tax=Eremomyces bilateralis CBS 781.70 TaxID=1392243 RepID=A0A6G1G6R7_9PEZI|nr:uncharacterized protein P152DRAFT_457890 [Eremomyces bilateralis CBS 781.70]KAF1813529.1 hypothetical protein P152DRAFT_457890 [Eremomyces bilateralis CBS 781.70]